MHSSFGALIPRLSLARWLVLGASVAAGTFVLLFAPAQQPRRGISDANWAIGLLLALWGMTVPISETVLLSTLKWAALLMQVVALVYFGGTLLTASDWEKIFVYGFGFLCVPVLLACVSLLLGGNPLWPYPTYVHGRLAAVTNPNPLGLVAALSGVVALWMLERWKLEHSRERPWRWRLLVVLFGLSVLVLYLTGSRSAGFGFLGGSLVWAIAARRSAIAVLVVVLGASIFAFSEPEPVRSTPEDPAPGIREDPFRTEALVKSREEVWAASYESWTKKPWFGYGYGRTGQDFTLRSVVSAPMATRDGSGYLGLLESVGVVGAFALVWLYWVLGAYIWRGIRAWRRGHRTVYTWILLVSGAALVTLAIQGGGEPWIIGPGSFMHVFFWLSIAALVAARSQMVEN